MRSLASQNDIFLACAALSAHALSDKEGFRQRDLKFFVELFTNWIETSFARFSLTIQNTQILRYVQQSTKAGIIEVKSKGPTPRYRLTQQGIAQLLKSCIDKDFTSDPSHLFFLVTYIRAYRVRIKELIRKSGPQFPKSLELEINDLLDTKQLLIRQLSLFNKSIQRIELRVKDGENIASYFSSKFKDGAPESEIIKEIEKQFPYELNNQKPLNELLQQFPDDLRKWELLEGSKIRSMQIFSPLLGIYKEIKNQIEFLLSLEP